MKTHQNYFCLSIVFLLLLMKPGAGNAQQDSLQDNGYYITYPDKLMVRVYLSQKFAPFTISTSSNNDELKYKTNAKLNLGIGATYRSLTLDLSFGFGFLNKEDGRGNTKGLDFQFHLYPHKWAIDLLGTFRKSYYLDPSSKNGLNLATYYTRPDLKRSIIGISAFRVPNADKFSYRAALVQSDWQTKSAGSFLFGGEAYYGSIKGDSAIVPNQVKNNFQQADVTKVTFFTIGPGIGYAYTLVPGNNFFITASATANIAVNFATEEKLSDKNNSVSLVPDFVFKAAAGYNSATWSLSGSIMGNGLYVGSPSSSKEYFLPTGIMRVSLAKKF